jgi:hypothetical protein
LFFSGTRATRRLPARRPTARRPTSRRLFTTSTPPFRRPPISSNIVELFRRTIFLSNYFRQFQQLPQFFSGS